MRLASIAWLLLAVSGGARAQSKRYPPVAPDKDREAEQRSHLWDSALHPERRTYEQLVEHTRPIVKESRPSEARLKAAIVDLDKAVALQPKRPDAYALRGEAYTKLATWAKCADDLAAAEQYAPRATEDPRDDSRQEQRKNLGTCQARAGRYAMAEQTLARAAATGSRDWQVWMRLGEARIALGKLDEAIGALTSAVELEPRNTTMRWLLAAAYDRARMPSQAAEQLLIGYRDDRYFSTIRTPPLGPYLGEDEGDYLLGLAYGTVTESSLTPPQPELQLAYFQRYLRRAPNSPWRHRAEEHVRELRAVDYPETIARRLTAPLDLEAARLAIKKGMPGMRACIGKLDTVLKVTITRSGPRSPAPVYRDPFGDRTRLRQPIMPAAPGVSIVTDENYVSEASRPDLDAAIRCVEPLADKIGLPVVKEKDSSYAVIFSVVGS